MIDMDAARKFGGSYIMADLSNYTNIKSGGFKTMKVNSKETVVDPLEQEEKVQGEVMAEIKREEAENVQNTAKDFQDMPAKQMVTTETQIAEMREIAKKIFLDQVREKSKETDLTNEAIESISNNAIIAAYIFEDVWNKKIQIGE